MVIKPKIIVGAIALAFGAVSFALSFFSAMPAGICGLIAGVLGLACGLDWAHDDHKSPAGFSAGAATNSSAVE